MAAPRELDLTITLETAWQSWETRLRSLVDADQMSPDTTRGYLAYSRRAIDHLGPDRTIDSIDAAEISGWLIAYRARGRGDKPSSPDTIRFCRKAINGLMAHAESNRWLRENPMRDVPRAPMPTRTTRPERAALARHELDAMLAAARAGHGSFNGDQGCWVRDEIAVRLAGESGLRNADIRDLDLDDIEKDPAGHWVVQIRRGKGRKAATVPVTDECATLIITYIEQWRPEPGTVPDRRDRHGKLFKGDQQALLLTAERHRFNTASVGHIVGRCAKAALGRHYVPHGLRHTTGTLLVREAKADLAIVAHVLRHSDISVTSVYLDTSNDEAAAAINRRKIGKPGSAASRQALPPGQDVPTWPEDCGTRRGWQRHRREKVPRCGPCRYWYRGAQQELEVLRRLMPERLHGTVSGFRDWKCRCDRCRAARALSDSPDCRLVLPPRPAMPRATCPEPECGKRLSLTAAGGMRRHRLYGDDCPGSGQEPAAAHPGLAPDIEPQQAEEQDEAA